jgi:hypothetical protein
MNKTITDYWHEAEKFKAIVSDEHWATTHGLHWSEPVAELLFPPASTNHILAKTDPYLTFAAHSGCVLYVADKTLGNQLVTQAERTALLCQMIGQFPHSSLSSDSVYNRTELAGKLELRHGYRAFAEANSQASPLH